jgi:hypothetical protein
MTRKPVIGISGPTAAVRQREALVRAVIRAGGVPLFIEPYKDEGYLEGVVETVAGVILAGGTDYLHGADPLPPFRELDPVRYDVECRIVRLAVDSAVPLLGICRGMQLLNEALGGTSHNLPREDGLGHCRALHLRRPPTRSVWRTAPSWPGSWAQESRWLIAPTDQVVRAGIHHPQQERWGGSHHLRYLLQGRGGL